MGILDSSSLTVNAILTTRGRELLSREGNININKFALSDEEIDYTLHDRKHANGTYAFGRILDNATLLEASPNRSKLNSYLQNKVLEGTDIHISPLDYHRAHWTAHGDIVPTTVGTAEEEAEDYTFTVQNVNIVKLWRVETNPADPWIVLSANTKSVVGRRLQWLPQSINTKATTTITVQGNVSGITKVVSITSVPNLDVKIYPKNTDTDVTDPKFY